MLNIVQLQQGFESTASQVDLVIYANWCFISRARREGPADYIATTLSCARV